MRQPNHRDTVADAEAGSYQDTGQFMIDDRNNRGDHDFQDLRNRAERFLQRLVQDHDVATLSVQEQVYKTQE